MVNHKPITVHFASHNGHKMVDICKKKAPRFRVAKWNNLLRKVMLVTCFAITSIKTAYERQVSKLLQISKQYFFCRSVIQGPDNTR